MATSTAEKTDTDTVTRRPQFQVPRKKEGEWETNQGRRPPQVANLELLHRSEQYLVVGKPPDVRMDGEFDLTVEKLAKKELQSAGVELTREVRLRFVHQLDYATSGVLVMALTRQAAAFASRQFERREVQKTYLALVYGTMSPGTYIFDENIAEDPDKGFRMAVGTPSNPGRTARTQCIPLGYGVYLGRPVTKVRLEPCSGRRHQLRVHLLNAGFPIVGDATYAEDSNSGPDDPRTPPRMFLHAWRLRIELAPPIGHMEFETVDPFLDSLELTEHPTPT